MMIPGTMMMAMPVNYSAFVIFRGAPSWRFPLPKGFSLTPGAAFQWTPERMTISGNLTASYDHRLVSLWLGGKYGDEILPAYMEFPVVYNLYDQRRRDLTFASYITYGVFAGLTVRLPKGFGISGSYILEGLSSGGLTQSFTLGIGKDF